MDPIVKNQNIEILALFNFIKRNFLKYSKYSFFIVILFIIYFFLKTPNFESKVSFYTNYKADQTSSLLSLLPGSMAEMTNEELKFSINNFLTSDKFLDSIIDTKFIMKTKNGNTQELILKDEWGKNYNKIFSLNPLSLLSKINRNLMYNSEVSIEEKKSAYVRNILSKSITFSEDRRSQLNTIVVRVKGDAFLAKQIADQAYNSVIEYSNEIQNEKGYEKSQFISTRLNDVKEDLKRSEDKMLIFLERNISLDSPALSLERNRLQKNIDLNSQLYFSLSDQLEIAKIDEKDNTSSIFLLDKPRISDKRAGTSFLKGIFIIFVGSFFFSFIFDFFSKRNQLII